MMAMLTLMEENSELIPALPVSSESDDSVESKDNIRSAVDLLVKAAGYLQFYIREILVQIPPHIKMKLLVDLQESVIEVAYIQALGQAHYCLSTCDNLNEYGKKHLSFIKWKYLEAKAATYYYHGLITDKGTEPSCYISAVCCFLAAEEILTESKKACLNFCLMLPITRHEGSGGEWHWLMVVMVRAVVRVVGGGGSLILNFACLVPRLTIYYEVTKLPLTKQKDNEILDGVTIDIGAIDFGHIGISCIMFLIHSTSSPAAANAANSDSIVEPVMHVCFLEVYEMAPPPSRNTHPLVEDESST
nr:hypothetical protein [Tanacetum cinerariifolium]